MKVVVDASVALKWVIPEIDSETARQLRNQELTAPSIWMAEVANGLWRHVLRGELEEELARSLLKELMTAPIETTPLEADLPTALRLASQLSHPIYDCLYLAAAQRLQTHVVTADRRFASLVSRQASLAAHIRPLA